MLKPTSVLLVQCVQMSPVKGSAKFQHVSKDDPRLRFDSKVTKRDSNNNWRQRQRGRERESERASCDIMLLVGSG